MGRKASGHDYSASLHPFPYLCLSVNVSCSLCSFQLIFLTCYALCRPIIPVCCHMLPVYWILSRVERETIMSLGRTVFFKPLSGYCVFRFLNLNDYRKYVTLFDKYNTVISVKHLWEPTSSTLFPAFFSLLGFQDKTIKIQRHMDIFFYARSS